MSAFAADRDLLFALLALQNGLIDQGQLVAAFQAWTFDKARPLAEHVAARGDLDPDQRAGIEAIVGLHLKKHESCVEKSLAAIPIPISIREELAALGDPDVDRTLSSDTPGPAHGTSVGEAPKAARRAERESPPTAFITEDDVTTDEPPGSVSGGLEATAFRDGLGDTRSDGDGLPPGAVVRYFGDYEIRRELGRGGMGVVYQARQVSLNRPVRDTREKRSQTEFKM